MNQVMRVCFWSGGADGLHPGRQGDWCHQRRDLDKVNISNFKKNGCVKDRLHVYLLQKTALLSCFVCVSMCRDRTNGVKIKYTKQIKQKQ